MLVRKRARIMFLLDADNAVVRARHSHVGLHGRATRQHLLIGRGHVRVRAEHRGHSPFEVPAERNLFRGGFGVDVHQDHLGL